MRVIKIFIAFLFLISVSSKKLNAQNWGVTGNGISRGIDCGYAVGDSFIVAHSLNDTNGQFYDSIQISIWNGSSFDSLPLLVVYDTTIFIAPFDSSVVRDMIYYNGELYVCGIFDSVQNVSGSCCIVKFDGFQWVSVGGGVTSSSFMFHPKIRRFTLLNNQLYVLGNFNKIGNTTTNTIAFWDGLSWHSIGFPSNPYDWDILDMTAYNNNLFICGYFNSIGTVQTNYIAQWDGTQWSAVGNNQNASWVQCLQSFNGKLYAGGLITQMGGVNITNRIAAWDGTTWTDASSGLGLTPTDHNFCVYQNQLVFTTSNSQTAFYSGSNWLVLNTNYAPVSDVYSSGPKLFGLIPDAGLVTPSRTFIFCDNSDCEWIQGTIYYDLNANCIQDVNENVIPNSIIKIGNTTDTTSWSGNFATYRTFGNYTIQHIPNPNSYSACPPNPVYNITTSIGNPSLNNNFGDTLNPNYQDLHISVSCDAGFVISQGSDAHYHIVYQNYGLVTMSGQVAMITDNSILFLSSIPAPSSINGDTLFWNYANLLSLETDSVIVTVHAYLSTPILTFITEHAFILPTAGDNNVYDNYFHLPNIIGFPWDPNGKHVSPAGFGANGNILAIDSVLSYYIDFQNTGTAAANHVIILDTLSGNLNLSSFSFIKSSHPVIVSLNQNYLQFDFQNINLPDSGSNSAGSHGFIEYSINQNPNLSFGTQIQNTASIYFDQNLPVVTNTTLNTITNNIGVETVNDMFLQLSPNPCDQFLQIETNNNSIDQIEIIDLEGKMLYLGFNMIDSKISIETHDLPEGLYLLKVYGNADCRVYKIQVQH